MPQQPDHFDLYAFVAGAALERGNPLQEPSWLL